MGAGEPSEKDNGCVSRPAAAAFENAAEVAELCKVFAVEARVKLVRLLAEETLCVNALSAHLEMSQPAVSQHLRVLRGAGLVVGEKRGYWVHYQLNRAAWEKAREVVGALFE